MTPNEKLGASLLSLKVRAGLSLDDIARRGGYSRRSSVQAYFNPQYEGPLSQKAAAKLVKALTGLGNPPITEEEILTLTGELPVSNARPIKFEGASLEQVRNDLPVYGTALGAERVVDGEAIEQTTLNSGEVLEYRKRPTISNGVERCYGLYIQGDSMYPAHRDGAFKFVQRGAPLRVGDDVVVYLRPLGEDDDGEAARLVLIKRLVRRTAQYVELEQFRPAKTFRIAQSDVLRIDRVLTEDDLA
jgi:phage repressor protein C with HTH and peptisase S24 domain